MAFGRFTRLDSWRRLDGRDHENSPRYKPSRADHRCFVCLDAGRVRSQLGNVRAVQPYGDAERHLITDGNPESARQRQSYCCADLAADAPALAGLFVRGCERRWHGIRSRGRSRRPA